MSKTGAAAVKAKTGEPDKPAKVYCVLFVKDGGGIRLSEGEVEESAVTVLRTRQAETWQYAIGRLLGWIEERFMRAKPRVEGPECPTCRSLIASVGEAHHYCECCHHWLELRDVNGNWAPRDVGRSKPKEAA